MVSTTISIKGTISKSNGFKRKKFDIVYTVNSYIQHYSTTQYYIRRKENRSNRLNYNYHKN